MRSAIDAAWKRFQESTHKRGRKGAEERSLLRVWKLLVFRLARSTRANQMKKSIDVDSGDFTLCEVRVVVPGQRLPTNRRSRSRRQSAGKYRCWSPGISLAAGFFRRFCRIAATDSPPGRYPEAKTLGAPGDHDSSRQDRATSSRGIDEFESEGDQIPSALTRRQRGHNA